MIARLERIYIELKIAGSTLINKQLKTSVAINTMLASILTKEFEEVVRFAEQGRSSDGWDGLAMWTECKTKFSDEKTHEWTGPILGDVYSSVRERILKDLLEFDVDGTMNEPNHFIIQCLRIPFKNQFTTRRLMQVAYNIGQFKAVSTHYEKKILDEFYALKLDRIETYYK